MQTAKKPAARRGNFLLREFESNFPPQFAVALPRTPGIKHAAISCPTEETIIFLQVSQSSLPAGTPVHIHAFLLVCHNQWCQQESYSAACMNF